MSTRGEIALANGDVETAADCFTLALAQKYDNATFVAIIQANLGRVAQSICKLKLRSGWRKFSTYVAKRRPLWSNWDGPMYI